MFLFIVSSCYLSNTVRLCRSLSPVFNLSYFMLTSLRSFTFTGCLLPLAVGFERSPCDLRVPSFLFQFSFDLTCFFVFQSLCTNTTVQRSAPKLRFDRRCKSDYIVATLHSDQTYGRKFPPFRACECANDLTPPSLCWRFSLHVFWCGNSSRLQYAATNLV